MASDFGKKGMGGWLIVVMIGLFVSVLYSSWYLNEELIPVFSDGGWEELTTPGTELYHYLIAPLLTIEMIAHVTFIIYPLILLYLLFQKSPLFPKLIISFIWFTAIYFIVDFAISQQIPATEVDLNFHNTRHLIRSVISASVWTSYFLKSHRVKNTFVASRSSRYPISQAPEYPHQSRSIQPTANGTDSWRR